MNYQQENEFLFHCGGDRELELARSLMWSWAQQQGVELEQMRERLWMEHLQREAERIAVDAENLQALVAYVQREVDNSVDEVDFMELTSEEFARYEQALLRGERSL